MDNKKVLVVRDMLKQGGGGCTMILWLARHLIARFDTKLVIVYENLVDKNLVEDIPVRYVTNASANRIIKRLQLPTTVLLRLNTIIQKEKPDVVISYGGGSFRLLTILSLFHHFKLIVSERRDPKSRRGVFDRINYFFYNFSSKVVFQSPGAKTCFNNRIQKKSVIIPNPIVITGKKWNFDKTDLSLVTVGRLEMAQKRQDILLQAFKNVANEYPQTTLHICGDGQDRSRLEKMAKELCVDDKVIFRGLVKDIPGELVKHRIFVFTFGIHARRAVVAARRAVIAGAKKIFIAAAVAVVIKAIAHFRAGILGSTTVP